MHSPVRPVTVPAPLKRSVTAFSPPQDTAPHPARALPVTPAPAVIPAVTARGRMVVIIAVFHRVRGRIVHLRDHIVRLRVRTVLPLPRIVHLRVRILAAEFGKAEVLSIIPAGTRVVQETL